jgi:AcrR family transcriptional regulator
MDTVRADNANEVAEKTEDLRVVKTRRALYNALERLMAQSDYSKISVTMLAREACVNRKTFYMHYQSIDDLVTEVFSAKIRDLCRDAAYEASSTGGRCGFCSLTGMLLAAIDENVDEEMYLIRNVQLLKLSEVLIDPLEEFLSSERSRRGLPERENPRGDVACYAGCVLMGYVQWRFGGDASETLDDVANRINRMAAGVAPDMM